ncbi:MAG: restriction endonuclease subunit S [Myxococcales bacterium]|nr:restriction endonuclease subunit S [Myxococcales bacterium]MCB9748693.1 restriction endonuclease subunit S [Myxococcales bacterium]
MRPTLPPDWLSCTLDDVKAPQGAAIVGGPFGSKLGRADYRAEGVPVIRGCNLGSDDDRFVADGLVFVSPEKARDLERNTARPGDVLFTQRGTLDQVGLLPRGLPWRRFVLSQSQMKLTCDRSRADPEFIYYQCRAPRVRDYVRRNTIATGVPHINLGILRRTPILLPPLREQRAIAELLGTIDRRIALGRRMNDTLDEMILAHYRAWFVHFAPVHANAHGRRHSSTDRECAALFPDGFTDIDGHRVPLGWTLRSARDCARLRNGATFTSRDFVPRRDVNPRALPVIKIAELKRGVNEKTRYSVHGHRGKLAIDSGDLLFAWSGTPEKSIGTHIWSGGPAWLNQHIYKVEPHAPIERELVYCQLRELQSTFINIARDHQTVGLGHVGKQDLERVFVVHPPRRLVERFHRRVAPLLDRAIVNDITSRELARLRDTLLPALMTGALRIEQAVALVRP